MRDVNGGWALRYVHANGASLFFFAVYCHIFRGIYYGSYKAPREITWIIGMLIFLLMMATAFMGYVLPWGQMSFWGATVITGLFSRHPAGRAGHPDLAARRAGGRQPDAQPLLLAALPPAVRDRRAGRRAYLGLPHHRQQQPDRGRGAARLEGARRRRDTLPFWPYFVIKDLFALVFVLAIFAAIVGFMPNFLGHPDNYIEANPLKTPAHIVPEWYFLPFYAMLRAITFDILWINSKLAGVLAMFGSIAVLLLLPWLDTSRVRSGRYRPMFKVWFWLLVVDFVRADVVRLAAAGAAVRHHQPARDALLVRLLPGGPAAPRRGREAAAAAGDDRGGLPRALRHRARPAWSAPRSASRPNERGRSMSMLKTTILAGVAALGLAGAGAGAGARGGGGHRLPLLVRGAVRPLRPGAAAARPAGLYRGLLRLPRAASSCPTASSPSRAGRRCPRSRCGPIAAMHDVDRRRRPARPARRRRRTTSRPRPIENAPDLSLMAKARAGFDGPARAARQPVPARHRRAGVYRLAAAGLHRRAEGGGGRGALREPRLPRRLDRDAAAADDDDQVTYADGTAATVEQMSQDVAAFLMWTAEPKMMARKAAGLTARAVPRCSDGAALVHQQEDLGAAQGQARLTGPDARAAPSARRRPRPRGPARREHLARRWSRPATGGGG